MANINQKIKKLQKSFEDLQESWQEFNEVAAQEISENYEELQSQFGELRENIKNSVFTQNDYVSKMVAQQQAQEAAEQLWQDFNQGWQQFTNDVEKRVQKATNGLEQSEFKQWADARRQEANMYFASAADSMNRAVHSLEQAVEQRIKDIQNQA